MNVNSKFRSHIFNTCKKSFKIEMIFLTHMQNILNLPEIDNALVLTGKRGLVISIRPMNILIPA